MYVISLCLCALEVYARVFISVHLKKIAGMDHTRGADLVELCVTPYVLYLNELVLVHLL